MEFSVRESTYVVPTAHQDRNTLNPNYNEILKLNAMLNNAKIPHRIRRLDDGWQVIYTPYRPDFSWVADAIKTRYSHGAENDLLELAGRLLTEEELKHDSAAGGLTANDVFERILKHWKEYKKEIATIFEEKDVNWIV